MRLFLCGDVMTGRGIDQIMQRPCDPVLHERYIRSALGYVELAERASGTIPRKVPFNYIWGQALDEIDRREPDFRIINLETSITADGTPEPKGINYRMHPDNVGCIVAAEIDCCVLANNHVADWGSDGLEGTVAALQRAGIATAGAGKDAEAAARPAILEQISGSRLLVFALASPSSGVPLHWAADKRRAGVNFLADFGEQAVASVARGIDAFRRPGDLVLVSIHWGPNWGYEVPAEHRSFAHDLIDSAGVDIIHGHSSHHPLAIEVYAGRPVLYGCGDFINDYEGIRGYEEFHPDLAVAYFLETDDHSRRLLGLELVPFRLKKFQLVEASARDALWLEKTLDRECRRFGGHVRQTGENTLALSW
ncbi:CapA family protein [Mesorhizobium sp. BAC0120]|uniref:CapA family protein n=1 Tax=Mesorhizobium sp. BAC0120 TaxID=3090670 RepID=UPI00298C4202|nr:CapA family protein [Mesorhizobium sp. BAC0120]MDW6023851.1 CapA family protein [Mesorhizobium sp. BAC0120]